MLIIFLHILLDIKFSNSRPSIIASACIAAVRQIHGIFPIWTPYLIKLTNCTTDIISPFVETILSIYRIHCNNERQRCLGQIPNTPISTNGHITILCDSPDSGIVSGIDTKSMKSDSDIYEEDDDNDNDANAKSKIESLKSCNNVSKDGEDLDKANESNYCIEYQLLPKRRRIF